MCEWCSQGSGCEMGMSSKRRGSGEIRENEQGWQGRCGQQFRERECRARRDETRQENTLRSDQELVMLIDVNVLYSTSEETAKIQEVLPTERLCWRVQGPEREDARIIVMLCRKYEECQKNEGKMVSNYETTLKTEYEYLDAA